MKSIIICILAAIAQICSAEYYRVCYYTCYASNRKTEGKMTPKDIDVNLCTHIIYAFAKVDMVTHTLMNGDQKNIKHEVLYKELAELKRRSKNKLKIMLSVGGASHEKTESPFSEMVHTEKRMKRFVNSAVMFLRQKGFDGLDVDWEYPAIRPENHTRPGDKKRFTHLIKSLSEAFAKEAQVTKRDRLLLSLAMPKTAEKIDEGYEIDELPQYVDFISIMAYAMTSASRKKTGHHSPLAFYKYNVVKAVTAYLNRNVPANKICLGVPTYGRSYRLNNTEEYGLEAPTNTTDLVRGPLIKAKSYLAHYEICYMSWTNNVTQNIARGPYSYNLKTRVWVSYDDEESIGRKIKELVFAHGLKGVSVWTIDLDDFSGKYCKKGKFPLINKIKSAFEEVEG